MPPLLSICIPTWNRAASLRKTLASFAAALPRLPAGAVELCLSDNGSTDETAAVISDFRAPGILFRHTRLPENSGFSGNYWSVASLATGKFSWITGDDDACDPDALAALVAKLSQVESDLVFINCAPWKTGVKSLTNRAIDGLGAYFSTLGVFHGSFIGNTVFATASLQVYDRDPHTFASAYPHMAPIFGLLRQGSARFLNLSPLIVDDSSRSWRARQPLFTAVDMARLATDLAFTGALCPVTPRLNVYILLLRSVPRAVFRVSHGDITIDPANPYQSITAKNLMACYRALPLAGPAACVLALVSRLAARFLTRTPR
ncbi:MAG: glycosyltransferase family 2 protein [Verrucomicrobiota bacterium]